MAQRNRKARKGDEVEVRFATHDNFIWHLATVHFANEDGFKVRFPSGHEKHFMHGEEGYRFPESRQCKRA
jgi:hypothetical protein